MNNNENAESVIDQDELFVVDYLSQHPGFFLTNQSLLTRIKVPHESGSAVSLVERQVGLYREKCLNLESHLNELVEVATENEKLNQKVHALACGIIGCTSFKTLKLKLAKSLAEGFGAERMAFHFLNTVKNLDDTAFTYGATELQMVRESMAGQEIVCGRLTDVQKAGLFGDDAETVESAALIWLAADKDMGLMVLGSNDANHFSPEKGVVFLGQIRDLVSQKVATLVQ